MKITNRERRAILLGGVAVAAILIYYAVDKILPENRNIAQTVEIKKKMLLRQRETLSRETAYRTRLQQVSGHLENYRTRLLPGDNPNVAGAELQNILKNFADQSGVEITSKSILQEKKTQDLLTRVSVKIDTNCNLDQLVRLLAAIENYEKYLKVDDCTISGFNIQRRFEIRPSLTVSGYIGTREEKS